MPFNEIQRYLLDQTNMRDFSSSYELRTFQRDMREIIDLFGITIKNCKNHGYSGPYATR